MWVAADVVELGESEVDWEEELSVIVLEFEF